ncbi:tetratricopeptide repeat protein [Thalassotalea eurytherma]|uniref:Response regulator n=1 Tax=Thalassotalea eurytherma TaxID=1144278 RepID=A0ABQ6H1W6_9GAMM|nr:tetratricopeptide repeat protein [Thalassotalea eurytherma]GLX82198.1 response regulator [Thalassotalea eurytherma]
MTTLNFANKRFLIVDNIKQSRDTLKQFAYSLGDVKVESVSFAKDAISACESVAYDVVLLGYDLGENQKNGQQVLEELKTKSLIQRQSIIIIITAEVSEAMVLAALEHKPDEYIAKPYTLQDLKKRLLRSYVKKQSMAKVYRALDEGDENNVVELVKETIAKGTQYESECMGILSRQYFNMKRYAEAQDIYLEYQNEASCTWAKIGLGKVAFENKQFDKAEQYFKEIIEENNRYLSAYDWLAKTYQAQENHASAQNTLERCLLISPRSVGRLKLYANVCLENEQFEKATNALKKTNELAYHSIHNHPENALLFAKAVLEHIHEMPIDQARKLNNKVFSALSLMTKDFDDVELKIRSQLLTACLQFTTKEKQPAKLSLVAAEKLLDNHQHDMSTQGKLESSRALVRLDREQRAANILQQLAQDNASDEDLLKEIDSCLTKPISDNIIKAQQAIEIGMSYYKQNQFSEAVNELSSALRIIPHHTGLKLNLLQVFLVAYEKSPVDDNYIQRASDIINDMDNLPTSSYSTSRYIVLKEKYQQLTDHEESEEE